MIEIAPLLSGTDAPQTGKQPTVLNSDGDEGAV